MRQDRARKNRHRGESITSGAPLTVVVVSLTALVLALLAGGCTGGATMQSAAVASGSSASLHPVLAPATDPAVLAGDMRLAARLDTELATAKYSDLRGMIVLDEGRTVYERSFHGEPTDRQHVWSITKSVVSTLAGIAIGEGLIPGVDSTLAQLLPDQADEMTPAVAKITLEQILTMAAGFTDHLHGEGIGKLVPRILDRQVWNPGEFHYTNSSAHLVSAIVAEASGMSVLDYARSRLFEPLGIESTPAEEPSLDAFRIDGKSFGWAIDGDGIHGGGYGLRLRAQDMAKLGLLFAQGGVWEGEQVVPASWVRSATSQHITVEDGWGYGYLWWIHTIEGERAFIAAGTGGQRIVVLPDSDLVAVWQIWVDPATNAEQEIATDMENLLASTVVPALT